MGLFDRFDVVYEQNGSMPVKIIRDSKTGVRYLVVLNGDGEPTAITPLLNSEGSLADR